MSQNLFSRLRTAILVLVGGYILLGPMYQQVLGGKNKYIRKWSMFHTTKAVCLVDYFIEEEDGERIEVDRFEVLGAERSRESRLHRISSRKSAIELGYRMCRTLGFKTPLYLEAKCSSRAGWTLANKGEVDLCEQLRQKKTGGLKRQISPKVRAQEGWE